jgi:tape measure domain-containing protein
VNATGIDLGAAYLAILPDTSKIAPGIKAALGVAEKGAADSGRRVGRDFSGAAAAAVKRAAPVLAAGLVVKGGLNRLLQIDDARAKLRGMKMDAEEIGKVQDSVSAAVDGTAFSLADGMNAATTALASGVKPGAELEKYLRLIGDVATQGGATFQEMGSIINQVTARGKVGQENLNRLTERGIGIQTMLADSLGVSGDQLSEKLRKGYVSAKDFQKALEQNFAGSAKKAGDTVRGSFANMRTSMSRLGATILEPAFKQAPALFQGITVAVKELAAEGGVATRIGEALGKALATTVSVLGDALKVAGKVLSIAKENKEVLAVLVGGYVAYRAAVKAAVIVEGALALWRGRQLVLMYAVTAAQRRMNTAMKANVIGIVVTALTLLVAGFVYAYKHSETFRSVVDRVWSSVKSAFASAWQAIRPVVTEIGQWLARALPVAFGVLRRVAAVHLKIIGTYFRTVWALVKPILRLLAWTIRNLVAPAIRFLWTNVVKPVFGWIVARIKSAWTSIRPAFSAIGRGASNLADAFTSVRQRVASSWSKIVDAVRKPLDKAKGIINGFLDLINKIPGVNVPLLGAAKVATETGSDKARAARGAIHRARGGAVFGPGTSISDSIPAWLSAGEHVLDAADVRNMGGHGAIYAMREAAARGVLPAFARGGAVAPGTGRQHSKMQYPWATWAGDFPNPIGTPVKAWKAGTVALVKSLTTSYGKHIRLNHTDGTSSLYAHLSSFAVKVGEAVRQGQIIGRVGSTGNSTGPHLHAEFMGGHYKGGSGGSVWDTLKGASGKITGWIKSKLLDKANIGGLLGNVSGLFGEIGNGVKKKVLGGLFDSGGVASGLGFMAKGTVQPERVLSPRQTRAFEAALARDFQPGEGGSGGVSVTVADFEITDWEAGMARISLLVEDAIDNYDAHQGQVARAA